MSKHPADVASFPSRFWLLWLWPLLRKGARQPLQEADIYEIPRPLKAEFLDDCWQPNISAGSTTLFRVLMRTYGWRYIYILFTFSFWLASLSMVPYLTDRLFLWLVWTEDTITWADKPEGLMWSFLLVGSYLVNCNSACQWYQQTTRLGCELRSSAAMMVFRRTLQLRIQDSSRDAALNLLQVDTERLYIFAQLNHLIYVALVVTTVSFVYLTVYEGLAVATAAIGVLLLTVILQTALSRCAWPARRRMQQCSDLRISLMAEILDAVKVLKMYGWTEPLQTRVEEIRQKELHYAWIYLGIRAFSSALLYISPSFAMLAVLLMMHLQGKELSAEKVFFIFTTVGLSRAPLGGVAMGFSAVVDGLTAFRRLNAFVNASQFDIYQKDLLDDVDHNGASTKGEEMRVSGTFSHGVSSNLKVDLMLEPGQLVAVCGRVASGKSSLLLAMLGEMKSTGLVKLPSGIAYLAQSPWIRSGTVRDAVIQDLPFEEKSYWRAVRAAQLLPDLRVWKGDAHPVGARGTTLSGGQRARLGLAQILYRCLVAKVELVLLDDCLAAVDVHVARAICEEALLGILLDGERTVVMVMNSNFVALRSAHRIVNLVDGVASTFSSIEEWSSACGESVWQTCQQTISTIQKRVPSSEAESFSDEVATLEKAETSQSGRLNLRTVTYYFGFGWSYCLGFICLGFVVLNMIGVEFLRIYADRFMGTWAERDSTNTEEESSNDFQTYCIWLSLAALGAFLRAWLVIKVALTSSKNIHHRLLQGIMSASLEFFDTIPRGRLLSLFSKDIDAVDALLPQYLLDFLQDFTMLLGVVVVCIWSTPFAATGVVPVLFAFYRIRWFFSCTARETKRLEGVSRGPLYSALGDVADGLATLRAHGQQKTLVGHFQNILDRNGKVFFQTNILQPWCILVLDSLGSAIVCAVCSFAVFAPTTLDVPTATMAISYSLMTRGKLQFCIRLSIETENQFVAAERLQHLEKLALSYQEVQHSDISQQTISKSWPQGSISFKEVLMHYRPEHPVLNGLNLEILAGQKVGLVGRTGSGKSSLLSALLRITEISSGAILVDGVNVGEIDLKKLRESISLVPQEPILWSGSVAENLDPSGIASEETLMQALRKVHLDQKLPQGLAMMVETRGNNFSLGQRQLLCIARCIARSSRIVLVDEATSCVDGETDALIQEAFQQEFKDCTMLVVAHRLQTVMNADVIAVLDAGRVVEAGNPSELAGDKSSHFAGLIRGCAAGSKDVFAAKEPLDRDHLLAL